MAGQTRVDGNLIDTGTDPNDVLSVSTGDGRYPSLSGDNTLGGNLTVDGDFNLVATGTGTGVFTVNAPDSNTDRTITVPDLDGEIIAFEEDSSIVFIRLDGGNVLADNNDSDYIGASVTNTSGVTATIDSINRGDDFRLFQNDTLFITYTSSGEFSQNETLTITRNDTNTEDVTTLDDPSYTGPTGTVNILEDTLSGDAIKGGTASFDNVASGNILSNGLFGINRPDPSNDVTCAYIRHPGGETDKPTVKIERANNASGGQGFREIALEVNQPSSFNSAGECTALKVFGGRNLSGLSHAIFAETEKSNNGDFYAGYFKGGHGDVNGIGVQRTVKIQTDTNGSGSNGTAIGLELESDNYPKHRGIVINSNYTGSDGQLAIDFLRGGRVGSIRTFSSSTQYNTSSDYRLKENVTDLSDGIDRLKKLSVHRFNFKSSPEVTVDGFIAHEVQEHIPEAVSGEKDGMEYDEEGNEVPDYQGIDQAKVVPLLTAALQEAIEKIEALEVRITELET